VVLKTKTWMAENRDGYGVTCHVTTGCQDEQAARHVLAEVVRRVERVKAGIIPPNRTASPTTQTPRRRRTWPPTWST